jgi:hypothetical protein
MGFLEVQIHWICNAGKQDYCWSGIQLLHVVTEENNSYNKPSSNGR